MRFFLDTNVAAYFLYNKEELSDDVSELLLDYTNIFLISTVCVMELTHLAQTGKLQMVRHGKGMPINPESILRDIVDAGIEIATVTERHLSALAVMPLFDDHRDPNDRLIMAQAISDRIPLVSSDRKFVKYGKYGLKFIFNER